MFHVVSFSSGLSSALATDRVLNRFGKGNVEVVFEDTLFEDDDNYRFLKECESRWGIEIIKLCEGRNPYQVAEDASLIPNSRMAPCTFRLKIELFRKWLNERYGEIWEGKGKRKIKIREQSPVTIYIGYDFTELERCDASKEAYNKLGWEVDFPLLWKPYENRPYPKAVRDDWDIEPPYMYALNYTHANCGGRCVKQGRGDWIRTLIYFPQRYKEIEDWEQWMRSKPKYKNYTIIKYVVKGIMKKITLKELREQYQDRKDCMPDVFDVEAPCVYCGVGSI